MPPKKKIGYKMCKGCGRKDVIFMQKLVPLVGQYSMYGPSELCTDCDAKKLFDPPKPPGRARERQVSFA